MKLRAIDGPAAGRTLVEIDPTVGEPAAWIHYPHRRGTRATQVAHYELVKRTAIGARIGPLELAYRWVGWAR